MKNYKDLFTLFRNDKSYRKLTKLYQNIIKIQMN